MSTNYKQITSFLFLFYGNHIIPFVYKKKKKKKKKKRERSYSICTLKPLCYIYVVYNFF